MSETAGELGEIGNAFVYGSKGLLLSVTSQPEFAVTFLARNGF